MGIGRSKPKIHYTYDEDNSFMGTIDDEGNGHGKILFGDRSVYIGDIKKNLIHGNGSCCYKDGSLYRGDWKHGLRNGKGVMYFANEECYEGDFLIDEIEGKGKHTYKDGSFYIGEFKFGKRFGYGTQYDGKNNIQYIGEWRFDHVYTKSLSKVIPSVSFEPKSEPKSRTTSFFDQNPSNVVINDSAIPSAPDWNPERKTSFTIPRLRIPSFSSSPTSSSRKKSFNPMPVESTVVITANPVRVAQQAQRYKPLSYYITDSPKN